MYNFLCRRLASNQRTVSLIFSSNRSLSSQISPCGISPEAPKSIPNLNKPKIELLGHDKKNLGIGFAPDNFAFAHTLKTQNLLSSEVSDSIGRSIRSFSTAATVNQQSEEVSKNKETFRPLSPHLLVYKPQLTSTLSIFNRICAAFLTTEVLILGLFMKSGSALTFPIAYQTLFYSDKLAPFALQMSALALTYHVLYYPYKSFYLK